MRSGKVRAYLRALRLHHWLKNLLLFVPLIFAYRLTEFHLIVNDCLAFVAFGLCASSVYLFNDIADLEADRQHDVKRLRPFASGDLPVAFGLIAAPLLIAAALAGAVLLSPAFAAALALYLVVTLAYSFGLKRLPLIDVFIISMLFVLRIVMGTAVIALAYSPWLLTFSWAFFLSLALAKRHVEVVRADRAGDVVGRGYRGADWPLTLAFGVGAGLTSIVIMLLYLANDAAPSGFYAKPGWLYAVPALMTVWLMRLWLLSHRMELDDDPVIFALRDPASLLLGLGVAVAFWLAL